MWQGICNLGLSFDDEKPEASKPISSHYGGERNRLPVKAEFLSCLGDQSKNNSANDSDVRDGINLWKTGTGR